MTSIEIIFSGSFITSAVDYSAYDIEGNPPVEDEPYETNEDVITEEKPKRNHKNLKTNNNIELFRTK